MLSKAQKKLSKQGKCGHMDWGNTVYPKKITKKDKHIMKTAESLTN